MLQINNLSVAYGEKQVLEHLNLECLPNKIHGILGMNGAGKTTLFNAIYGITPKQAGEFSFQEKAVHTNDIAFLETSNFFYSYMQGKEYLELCALHNPNFDIQSWNQLFQLPLRQLVDTYSTGMKKKLALLGILALNRPILILDEPFNGVDFESSEVIYELLRRLRIQGKIILLSSHIIESLTNVCDHVSYLSNGKIEKRYEVHQFDEMEKELRTIIQKRMTDAMDELF